MKQTFTTVMPDQIGAFLKADRCLTELGLNITRVSYNKAVDKHTLFIEAEGSKEQLQQAEAELAQLGYLHGIQTERPPRRSHAHFRTDP